MIFGKSKHLRQEETDRLCEYWKERGMHRKFVVFRALDNGEIAVLQTVHRLFVKNKGRYCGGPLRVVANWSTRYDRSYFVPVWKYFR